MRCPATLDYELSDAMSADLACSLGEGHKRPHHTEMTGTEKRSDGVTVEVRTSIEWTDPCPI